MQKTSCALQRSVNVNSLVGLAVSYHWYAHSNFQQKQRCEASRVRNHFCALLRCSVTPVLISVTGSVIRHWESGQTKSSGGAGSPASIVVSSSKLTLRHPAAGLGLVLGCASNVLAAWSRHLQARVEG